MQIRNMYVDLYIIQNNDKGNNRYFLAPFVYA